MLQKDILKLLAHCLNTYREKKQYSQEQMAELCNLSLKGYQNLEQGTSIPSLTTALRIRDITGMDLNTLTLPDNYKSSHQND